jgi:hypothetical protein
VHLQLAGGRRRVDAFGEADEDTPNACSSSIAPGHLDFTDR